MLFDEGDAALLKGWITKRLEAVSDADEDVLSDYILALVSSPDESAAAARENCLENLKDFLGDTADKFVDDLFTAINTKSYAPKATVSTSKPRRTSIEPPRQSQSRKRLHPDWDRDNSQNSRIPSYESGNRPWKQPRRGGRDQRGRQTHNLSSSQHQPPPLPPMPTPPPGMPLFDMADPIGSFMAMQQAMGMLPGFPPLEPNGESVGHKERCRDFDTKGYCTKGASCPFDHGAAYVVPGEEYDPNCAALMNVQPTRTGVVNSSSGPRSRGRHRGRNGGSTFRCGGQRADISLLGANHDQSNTSIVVEQIPEEHFYEQAIRDFFSDFGNIEEITMKPYRRLAIIKYGDYEFANAAYNSPKVIFDNRFVKVYWYNADRWQRSQSNQGSPSTKRKGSGWDTHLEEPEIDPEELARKQEDAQRKYDEQHKQREEAKSKKRELDAQVKAIEAERKKMTEALVKKGTGKDVSSVNEKSDYSNESEQTKGLREQLAKLEAEAKSLGIDPNVAVNSYDNHSGSHGRGGYRGRYRGRGVYNAFRGGWAGGRGGSVKRLDNRPKTVAITFLDGSYEDHEESLRQWLLFNGSESAMLTKHPSVDRQDVALVAFPERYMGENFMAAAGGPDFPISGQVELSWWNPDATDVNAIPAAPVDAEPDVIAAETLDEAPSSRDVDSDDRVEDDDRWG